MYPLLSFTSKQWHQVHKAENLVKIHFEKTHLKDKKFRKLHLNTKKGWGFKFFRYTNDPFSQKGKHLKRDRAFQ
jgi:hypothetical protein